jgi:LysR family transcriptional regulator for metE and metH
MANDLARYSVLDLRHLRLVWTVAESRSLTRAALRLRLTTSALSHQLRQLEDLVGTAVFDREQKQMRPTPAGEMLLGTAERVLEILQDTERQLESNGSAREEVIRLCTHCYTGYRWLPGVVRRFQRTHPNADVRIVPEATREPVTALRERRLDLVISFDPPRDPFLTTQTLFSDELLLIVSRNHRLARRKFFQLRELANEHLIMHADDIRDSHFVQRYLSPANIRPKRFTGVTLTEGILEMVRAGLGVTVLPRWATGGAITNGLIARKLTKRGLKRTWYAVTHERVVKGTALQALIASLRNSTRELTKSRKRQPRKRRTTKKRAT